MSEYLYKIIRQEWCVVLCEVDQYGIRVKDREKVLSAWPTQEAAREALPTHGKPHSHVRSRWIPNNAPHEYCELRIVCVDKKITEWFG